MTLRSELVKLLETWSQYVEAYEKLDDIDSLFSTLLCHNELSNLMYVNKTELTK